MHATLLKRIMLIIIYTNTRLSSQKGKKPTSSKNNTILDEMFWYPAYIILLPSTNSLRGSSQSEPGDQTRFKATLFTVTVLIKEMSTISKEAPAHSKPISRCGCLADNCGTIDGRQQFHVLTHHRFVLHSAISDIWLVHACCLLQMEIASALFNAWDNVTMLHAEASLESVIHKCLHNAFF